MTKSKTKAPFQPRIVVFACNWCSYPAADAAGINRMQYPPNVRIIRTMCMGRVNPGHVLKAFEMGADGVVLVGCKPGTCRYGSGTATARENTEDTRDIIRLLGLRKER